MIDINTTERTGIDIDGREWCITRRVCPITSAPYWAATTPMRDVPNPNGNGRPVTEMPLGYVQSPGEEFMDRANSRATTNWNLMPADAYGDEIARLRREGYEITADDMEARRPANRPIPKSPLAGLLIDVDPTIVVSWGVFHIMGLHLGDVLPYLKRHASGDWGNVGKLADARPQLTDASRLVSGLFDRDIQNAATMERGFGLVKSVYPVGHFASKAAHDWEATGHNPHPNLNPQDAIEIWSLIVPRGPAKTIVFSPDRG